MKKILHHKLFSIGTVLLLTLLAGLTACKSDADTDLPAAAARDWLKAANGIYTQKAAKLTCSDKVDELKASRETGADYILVTKKLRSFSSQNDVDIAFDASGVEFNVLSMDSEEVVVEVIGDAKITMGEGSPSPTKLEGHWLMVLEDGQWKWCGEAQ